MFKDFRTWFKQHVEWSKRTFGPASERGPEGAVDHLRKEIEELAKDPTDLEEIVDIFHLATDAAWRGGHTFEDLIGMLFKKQDKNIARKWPDWRTAPKGRAIEHVREDGEKPKDTIIMTPGIYHESICFSCGHNATWHEGYFQDPDQNGGQCHKFDAGPVPCDCREFKLNTIVGRCSCGMIVDLHQKCTHCT